MNQEFIDFCEKKHQILIYNNNYSIEDGIKFSLFLIIEQF